MAYPYGRPKLVPQRNSVRMPNEHCRKITYRNGDAYECGAPTKGRTYCAACERRLITLTDRVPASVEPPRKHRWRENMKL